MITQGHKYNYNGWEVLAMQSGEGLVKVAPIDQSQPYPLGHVQFAQSEHLVAMPMNYFHGEVPA